MVEDFRLSIVTVIGLSVICFVLSPPSAGAHWNEFRGPTGQGHANAPQLPLRWSASENVRWKQAVPGEGWSSPVVIGRRIYLTTAVPLEESGQDDYSLQVVLLDADTGQLRGSVEVFRQDGSTAPSIHTKNSHASPTPVLADNRLYVHFGHQGTACLELNGRIVWRTRELEYNPVHGSGGSPVVVGDKLIFSGDGAEDPFVAALDRETGEVVWKTARSVDARRNFSFGTPLHIVHEGRSQLISPGSEGLFAYDPETGKELWRVRHDGYSVIPRPVYGHGLIFFGTGYNTPSLLAIRPDGHGDVTDTHVAWQHDRGAPHTPSPLLVDDQLYIVSDNGVATCLDARSGDVHWQQRLGGNFSASPVYANGHIYFQNEDGRGFVVKAGIEYDLVAQNDLDERTLASYAVVGDSLLIRTAEHVYRIEP